jgi:single-stranded DNA-binding protein
MTLEAGYTYVMGNLTRDWETKEIDTKNGPRTLYTCGLAYQPKKEDETQWVNLTIWPDFDNGSTDQGRAVSDGSHKGVMVIARGLLERGEYKDKTTGEKKFSWELKVWQVAKVLRAPKAAGGDHVQQARDANVPQSRTSRVENEAPRYEIDEEPF